MKETNRKNKGFVLVTFNNFQSRGIIIDAEQLFSWEKCIFYLELLGLIKALFIPSILKSFETLTWKLIHNKPVKLERRELVDLGGSTLTCFPDLRHASV